MYVLNHSFSHVTRNNNIDLPQCDDMYFEIEYKGGKGHFKILLFNMICRFSLNDNKKIIEMLSEDPAGLEKANYLHDLYIDIVKDLNKLKELFKNDKKKLSEISAAFKRLNNLNDILKDYFNIDSLEIEAPIKMKSTIAYKMIGNKLVIDYKAKSFTKFGRTWVVSIDSKIRGRKHIIVPSCGLPCFSYNGSFKEAIEIIDIELKNRVEKALQERTFPEYIELLKQNGIDSIPA